MLLPQKELCLEECQIEASDYGLVSDARLGSAARRRTILIFFREAKFSSPPSLPLWPDRAAGAPWLAEAARLLDRLPLAKFAI